MKNNKAFTLIELLVVILIIGILAAVAMPQYQLARDKAEFSKLWAMNKNLSDAYERYYLVANEYPQDIEDLDVDLPAGYTKSSYKHGAGYQITCASYNDFYCCIAKKGEAKYYPDQVLCSRNDYAFQIIHYSLVSEQNPVYTCAVPNKNKRGIRLCENISGKTYTSENSNFMRPTSYLYQDTLYYLLN